MARLEAELPAPCCNILVENFRWSGIFRTCVESFFLRTYRYLITITPSLQTKKLFYSVTQLFYLFCFAYAVLSFVGGDYCTNNVSCFYHTLLVFMVHFTVLCF